ncbi:hypothetical protein [Limnohabitans sp.]|uniref:hypothetical protein n=1 Tax=Limnohabitans sp. TaxID=1907725 RepID=UPI002AFE0B47|nr:hypothetical protein [Limnohabitans sp.]
MSITFQNLNLPTGLYNLPKRPEDSSLPRDAFELVGTPTANQIVVKATYKGMLVQAVVDGNFQYPNGLPTNLADFSAKATGTTTKIETSINGVVMERTVFSPGVDAKLENQAKSSKAAAEIIYSGNDTFIGFKSGKSTAASDVVDGFGGNDIFYGNGIGEASDIFYGGSGRDTSVYRGKKANYTIAPATVWDEYTQKSNLPGLKVTDKVGIDGSQYLHAVERLQFTDGTLAFDFQPGENGYKAAMLIGAAFGAQSVGTFFAPAVQLFDQGKTTAEMAQLVVDLKLIENTIGNTSNKAFVVEVYENVVGMKPDIFSEAIYINYLDTGAMSKAQLLTMAASAGLLETQINLTGLQTTGVFYSGFIGV